MPLVSVVVPEVRNVFRASAMGKVLRGNASALKASVGSAGMLCQWVTCSGLVPIELQKCW